MDVERSTVETEGIARSGFPRIKVIARETVVKSHIISLSSSDLILGLLRQYWAQPHDGSTRP